MTRQDINILTDVGAKAYRVGEALLPITGIVAPDMDAEFYGQVYIDTTAGEAYIAIAMGTGASDWIQVTPVA